jgi:anti-sigma regulatory factor (Ser/Thr protein kinase)
VNSQLHPPPLHFTQRFGSTALGARQARLQALLQLDDWGYPSDSPVAESARLIVGELAANAVAHGHVPGRDFRLRMTLIGECLWIEVTDARGESGPPPVPAPADPSAESGRGLLLVAALARRWGITGRPAPGKTVWAEMALPAEARP